MLKKCGTWASNKSLFRYAENGKEGVEQYVEMFKQKRRPDLILMDCGMPEMNGYEATREIRAFERKYGLDPVAIVAVTANSSSESYQVLDADMNYFIGKPITAQEIEESLFKLFLNEEGH